MKIAIIGAGNVGQALGAGWAQSGHQISYGLRDPGSAKAAELKAAQPEATLGTNETVSSAAEVIVITTPWAATEAAIRACGSLAGKILIDVTNPLKADLADLIDGTAFTRSGISGGEQVAQWATGAEVYKTMNQVGAALMDRPKLNASTLPVMFVAGDGPGKRKVLQLVTELGHEAIDVGPLLYARLLEYQAMLWIQLAVFKGQGPTFAFGLLHAK